MHIHTIFFEANRHPTRWLGSAPPAGKDVKDQKEISSFLSLSLLVPQRLFQRALGFCCATLEIFSPACRCRHSLGRFSPLCPLSPAFYMHMCSAVTSVSALRSFPPRPQTLYWGGAYCSPALVTYYVWLLILSCNWSAPRRLE